MYIPKDVVDEPLYVVFAIFNPVRFKSRWKLYRDALFMARNSGAICLTVEATFGEREAALEDHAYPWRPDANGVQFEQHYKSFGPSPVNPSATLPPSRLKQDYLKVQVGQQQEIWLKENLQNYAVQHLPPDAKYIAFLDADISFARPDWVSETLHALQHFDVVQMFSTAIDLSPKYEPFMAHKSFGYNHINGIPSAEGSPAYYYVPQGGGKLVHWHPGFAWAWRKSALDNVGGLIDWGVTGANDHHMAKCLIGRGAESYAAGVSEKYKEKILAWQEQALYSLKMNIGYIDGTLLHYWHGRKVSRGYESRWQILVKNNYDPYTDIRRDMHGIYVLTDKKPALRDDLRKYFRSRQEDDIHFPLEDDRLLGPAPATKL